MCLYSVDEFTKQNTTKGQFFYNLLIYIKELNKEGEWEEIHVITCCVLVFLPFTTRLLEYGDGRAGYKRTVP
jgi:hypothetical protein